MAYTLLQLVDQVSGELGLAQPTIVIGSAENQTRQFLALVQRLGKDLIREFQWRGLVKSYVFQTSYRLPLSGTTTIGSKVITSITTANVTVGEVLSGTGIPTYSEVVSIDSSSQLTMTMPATASGTISVTHVLQDYDLPSDFDRLIPDTNWDRTDHWSNIGPESSQSWQALQGGSISVGPRERFRLYGNKMRIFPALAGSLASPYNFAYEYVSNFWIYASGDTTPTKSAFTVDSDTYIFPDDMMMAGLKYYWLKAKKLDYGPEMAEFSDALAARKAQDQPQGVKSLNPRVESFFITSNSVPEGSWNL